jgi:hypothetical protein
MIHRSLRDIAPRCRERLQQQRYACRAARLPKELQELLECFEARVPLDDIIDEYAVRIHGTRPGQPTPRDLSRAKVRLMNNISQLRHGLDL